MSFLESFFPRIREREDRELYQKGIKEGNIQGINTGLTRHFEATSELEPKEEELLIKFLTRHNMVMCYDLQYGGFRIRKAKYNYQQPKHVFVVDEDQKNSLRPKSVNIIDAELMDLDREFYDNEEKIREEYYSDEAKAKRHGFLF